MDDDTLLLYAGLALAGYFLFKGAGKALFQPKGTTQEGIYNLATRAGADNVTQTDKKTFIQVGSTVYGINASDLPQTGFIRRRAAFVSALPSFLQTDYLKNWVYT